MIRAFRKPQPPDPIVDQSQGEGDGTNDEEGPKPSINPGLALSQSETAPFAIDKVREAQRRPKKAREYQEKYQRQAESGPRFGGSRSGMRLGPNQEAVLFPEP